MSRDRHVPPTVLGLGLALVLSAGCGARSVHPSGSCASALSRTRQQLRQQQARQTEMRRELKQLRQRLERQSAVVEVARSISALRGLPIRRPIRVQQTDVARASQFIQRELERELPRGYEEAYVATLGRVGLLPRGYRLRQQMGALMDEQVAGFYDPRTRQLFVRSDMPAGELILAHEVTHALQDQSTPLLALQGERKDHDDRAFAIRALVEGDATVAMVAYLRRTLSLWKLMQLVPELIGALTMDQRALQSAPAYLREGLVQPYLRGMVLVQTLLTRGGWRRVDRAYRSPPVSSEQVLHPGKYLVGEQPVTVVLPPLGSVLPGARVLHENTLGELGLKVLLQQSLGQQAAERAAAGWGGDRLRGLRLPSGEVLVLWMTAWDSVEDAKEFRAAAAAHLTGRDGPPRGGVWLGRDGAHAALFRRGLRVLLVEGARGMDQARRLARLCRVTGR